MRVKDFTKKFSSNENGNRNSRQGWVLFSCAFVTTHIRIFSSLSEDKLGCYFANGILLRNVVEKPRSLDPVIANTWSNPAKVSAGPVT